MFRPLNPHKTIHFWKGDFLEITNISKLECGIHRHENAGRLKTIFYSFFDFYVHFLLPLNVPQFKYDGEFYVDMF